MSRIGKVVAVAAVAGSVAWVGHQIVRHHHKAEKVHDEISEFIGAVHERHRHDNNLVIDFVVPDFKGDDVNYKWTNPAADDSDSMVEPQLIVDSVESMTGDAVDSSVEMHEGGHTDGVGSGRQWRRHHQDGDEGHSESDDEHEERRHRRHGRLGRKGGCHKPVHGDSNDHEQQHSGASVDQQGVEVSGMAVTSVGHVEIMIGVPYENEQQIPEQPMLIDPMPELEDNNEVTHREDGDDGFAESRRHHGRWSRDEEHFRKIEGSLSEEEKAEFRRLRKEARRLHCDSARTAGGFAAGAAFAGGIAHLARLRRERREAAAQSVGSHEGESSVTPSATNA